MNTNPGILATKVGMTQIFLDDGTVVPCTAVQGGCVVVGKRTKETDGYDALVLGLGERKEKHANKAQLTSYKKAGVTPKKVVREFRSDAEYVAKFEIGQELKVEDIFEAGQKVDVQGNSRGHGFTGVMVRHNFGGSKASHGARHETVRHGGSIGTTTTPGRVLKGTKMAGQHGNKTVSVLNLKVAKVIPEKQLVLLQGGVPGSPGDVIKLRGAVKKRLGKPGA